MLLETTENTQQLQQLAYPTSLNLNPENYVENFQIIIFIFFRHYPNFRRRKIKKKLLA